MPDEKLILSRGSDLARVGPQGGRILEEMVGGALTVARATDTGLAEVPRFRIGHLVLCDPDYRQVLLWAKALNLNPEVVLERLLTVPETKWHLRHKTQLEGGRIIRLLWDFAILPQVTFEWVEGLAIEAIAFDVPEECILTEGNLALSLPELRSLGCGHMALRGLDLSGVPKLTKLWCGNNQLSELDLSVVPHLTYLTCNDNRLTGLDLSRVPQITVLQCDDNQITKLDLSVVPHLQLLMCGNNQLTEIDLSVVPQLNHLSCSRNDITGLDLSRVPKLAALFCTHNKITKLDLSAVPLVERLQFGNNQIAELDIRPLVNTPIILMIYGEDKTRLIRRPDQGG